MINKIKEGLNRREWNKIKKMHLMKKNIDEQILAIVRIIIELSMLDNKEYNERREDELDMIDCRMMAIDKIKKQCGLLERKSIGEYTTSRIFEILLDSIKESEITNNRRTMEILDSVLAK